MSDDRVVIPAIQALSEAVAMADINQNTLLFDSDGRTMVAVEMMLALEAMGFAVVPKESLSDRLPTRARYQLMDVRFESVKEQRESVHIRAAATIGTTRGNSHRISFEVMCVLQSQIGETPQQLFERAYRLANQRAIDIAAGACRGADTDPKPEVA